MPRPRRIIAMGGGGFLMEDSTRLDDHVLAATGVDHPKLLFIPTATGDSFDCIEHFHSTFAGRADAADLPLFRRRDADLRAVVLAQDAVYVAGGNTANMLAIWRLHGLDDVLREAYAAGVVLAGMSAGAVCWFEGATTDSFGPGLRHLDDGLGLLPGTFVPHYGAEPERRPTLHALVAAGTITSAWAVDDGAALDWIDGRLAEVVTSRPEARAYEVTRQAGVVHERPLP